MTLAKTGTEVLSTDEWNELVALKDAITYAPQTVSAQKMEKFADKINIINTIQNDG